VVLVLAGSAFADTYVWDFAGNDKGVGGIHGEYNADLARLTWSIDVEVAEADGLAIVFSDGVNPIGQVGEYAMLYVDASGGDGVLMTAYAHNAQNNPRSWLDGDGVTPGTQAADGILPALTSAAGDWVLGASVEATGEDGDVGTRFSFVIDAARINAHSPLYTAPWSDGWKGTGFREELGVYLNAYTGLEASYGSAGFLEGWSGVRAVSFNAAGEETITVVPLPTPALLGLAGLASVWAVGRRLA